MPKTYTRLTEDKRYQIYEGVTEKRSHRKIARLINRHHLRHCKPYKKLTDSADTRGQIIGWVSIDERLSIVDKKERLGD